VDTEINLNNLLAESFLKAGYIVDRDLSNTILQPLNLIIKAEVQSTEKFESETTSVKLNISCKHHEKIPGGITEMAMGWGENYEKAVQQAFSNWIISDFTPIHDYLCSSDHLLGAYEETVSCTGELGEIIGWDLFFGPRLEALQNMNSLEITENKKDQKQIQQTLFQAMTDSLFGTPGLYYIRIFMSKINNSQIDCDCRVNGNEWEHGKNYLIDYIAKYQANPGVFWIKQNLLLVDKSPDKIRSSHLIEELNRELSRQKESLSHVQKKWWKFWK